MANAIKCVDGKTSYKIAGITRNALWQRCGIDGRRRFSYYRNKLKKVNVYFEVLELKLAFFLTLFCSDILKAAKENMFAFGHFDVDVPDKYRIIIDDYRDDCYDVLRYIYAEYSAGPSADPMLNEKLRVVRIIAALDYIYKNKKDLYAYFFLKKP